MADYVLNYDTVVSAISYQFQTVWNDLIALQDEKITETLSAIKSIEVSDEQHFVESENSKKLRNGTLYVVVKFGAGPINYGSTVSPISLTCVGTANKVKPVQLLLGVFASTWTTKNLKSENGQDLEDIIQVWNTPEVISNFNTFEDNFRNIFKLNGNILFGLSSVRLGTLTYFYDKNNNYPNLPAVGWEEISIMSFQDGYRSSLDPQPFGNTGGFAKSVVNFSTYTFTISTYLLANKRLSADILALRGFRNRKLVNGEIVGLQSFKKPNDDFKLKLEFTNGFTNFPNEVDNTFDNDDATKNNDFYEIFKVTDSGIGQQIAGIPMLSVTFSR